METESRSVVAKIDGWGIDSKGHKRLGVMEILYTWEQQKYLLL